MSDDDQEIIQFLLKTGEEHMARKPISRSPGIVSGFVQLTPGQRFREFRENMFVGGTRSKWERIGKPLFSPSIEMAMYFTPMNPLVYRMIRAFLTAHDIEQGVYDYD